MKIIAIIPARMNSTRFPGKPLAPILGIPMIEHVRRRVALSSIFSDVVVATCDEEIKDIYIYQLHSSSFFKNQVNWS